MSESSFGEFTRGDGTRTMKLSTRARYGMRMMIALAENYGRGSMYLKDIARAEDLSEKYLTLLVIPLKRAGLIQAIRGAYGGYALAKAPSQINLEEIVEVLEGRGIVDCLKDASSCPRYARCRTRGIWEFLDERIYETLRSITLDQWMSKSERKRTDNSRTRRTGKES